MNQNTMESPKESKRLFLFTYGCQMNKYDSEVISGLLSKNSYSVTEDLEAADVILFNTCSIREKAEQKVYSQIGRLKNLKKKKPGLLIGVGGCVGQLRGEDILKKAPLVDFVFGTANTDRVPALVKKVEETGERIADVGESENDLDPASDIIRKGTVHAWVSVMRGCDNYCSYCVVPYARGREKSRLSESIFLDIKQLVEGGYKEVTLLGQNVNSYGKDFTEGLDFPDLLASINSTPGLERIRFVTSHPRDFSEKLVDAMKTLDKVCESIHLPVQSGSDRVLQQMNRGYTESEYMDKLDMAKGQIKNLSITSDIIVGFPGESEKDFLQTKDLVEKAGYDSIFLFKYSKRPETPAALFDSQVPDDEKQRRFEEILKVQKEISVQKNREYEGKSVEVLVEGPSKNNTEKMTGRTRTNKVVNFSAESSVQAGDMVSVTVTRGRVYGLEGVCNG